MATAYKCLIYILQVRKAISTLTASNVNAATYGILNLIQNASTVEYC
jgi:hypothetical protein